MPTGSRSEGRHPTPADPRPTAPEPIPLEKTGGVLNALAHDLYTWQQGAPVIDATHEDLRAVIGAAMLLRGFLKRQRGTR